MNVLVIEGGGQGNKALRSRLREGFADLVKRGGAQTSPKIVMAGARSEAFGEYKRWHESGERVFLLIDSESAVSDENPWEHLQRIDHWECPAGASPASLHFMVQMTESWFLADASALKRYFGQATTVPANIESLDKSAVLKQLGTLAANSPKREYLKVRDSHELLKLLDPDQVKRRSRWAHRFFEAIRS